MLLKSKTHSRYTYVGLYEAVSIILLTLDLIVPPVLAMPILLACLLVFTSQHLLFLLKLYLIIREEYINKRV